MSSEGIALIQRWESCRLKVYQDSIGIWTIGFGAIRGLDGLRLTAVSPSITQAQACFLLLRDSKIAAQAVAALIDRQLSGAQAGALGSWVFNLGESRLKTSTLRRVINSGQIGRIAEEWVKWNRAGGKVLAGLTARRQAELAVYQS